MGMIQTTEPSPGMILQVAYKMGLNLKKGPYFTPINGLIGGVYNHK